MRQKCHGFQESTVMSICWSTGYHDIDIISITGSLGLDTVHFTIPLVCSVLYLVSYNPTEEVQFVLEYPNLGPGACQGTTILLLPRLYHLFSRTMFKSLAKKPIRFCFFQVISPLTDHSIDTVMGHRPTSDDSRVYSVQSPNTSDF